MGSSVAPAVYYCCIWNGKKKVHSQSNGDSQLEKLANLCLENTPPFHRSYFRTVKGRTHGFLVEDGITYFAIANSSIGNPSILLFLQRIRDGYTKFARNGLKEELVPIVERLVASLESLPRQNALDQVIELQPMYEGATSTNIPLLGKSTSKKDGKKMGNRAIEAIDDNGNTRINRDVTEEVICGFSLQRSLSSNGCRNQLIGQRLWLRHLKIVLVIDMLVCLGLFGIWLAICRGFQCIK